MPIGLTNIPITFQSIINKALYLYLDIFYTVYLDNILIYTNETLKEYIEQVKKVITKLKKYRLLLQPNKYEFYTYRTKYLGFIILENSVEIDLKKIQVVKDQLIPKTIKDVQSFLGFTNFYRQFVEKYLGITAPLLELTKKGIVIVKGGIKEEPLEVFETLTLRFTIVPIL